MYMYKLNQNKGIFVVCTVRHKCKERKLQQYSDFSTFQAISSILLVQLEANLHLELSSEWKIEEILNVWLYMIIVSYENIIFLLDNYCKNIKTHKSFQYPSTYTYIIYPCNHQINNYNISNIKCYFNIAIRIIKHL